MIIRIERISARGGSAFGGEKPKKGDSVHFDKVLLLASGEGIKFGDPYIKGVKIDGKLLKEGRYKKITHLRYHSKTRRQRKQGHRQIFSEVSIGDF